MFKEKYKKPLQIYEKFWEREKLDRCVLNVFASVPQATYREHTSLYEKWLDEEYIYQRYKNAYENLYYAAEGVPMLFTNLGPGCLSACVGGGYTLNERTIWLDREPIIDDWENVPPIKLNTDSEMWQHLTRLQNRFKQDSEVPFSITDLGGIMDIICSLRSTQELLYDLYDYPEQVKAFTKEVERVWFEAFDKQVEVIRSTGMPYNNWMNIPSTKPWYPIQSDFCAMLSPEHFEEFILPHIVNQANYMERSIYHLDGTGELPHLDMLLDIPTLTGIQWTAGAGQAPLWGEKWFDIYRKIQDKKKNLVLLGGISENDLDGAERLIKSLDPTGTYISIWCSSPQNADRIVELIERWSK